MAKKDKKQGVTKATLSVTSAFYYGYSLYHKQNECKAGGIRLET